MQLHRKKTIDTSLGIYIHIPFCLRRCLYCDFNSIAVSEAPGERYVEAVIKELSFHLKTRPDLLDKTLETIYIGGGTPSLIETHSLRKVVSALRSIFPYTQEQEITIEINPGTATTGKLAGLKDSGINRLSIGVQSLNDAMLESIGRMHSAEDTLACCALARTVGFNNIGVDLLFGMPGQTVGDWELDLEAAISLKPEHISTYNLTVEENTPYYQMQQEGKIILPSEEEQVCMYELASLKLKTAGYIHYEISNFSRRGFESNHNNRYWLGKDYIGLGAGAHSYLSRHAWGIRWWNTCDPAEYMQQIEDTGSAVKGKEELSEKEARAEALFLGLRKLNGIDLDRFSSRFGRPLEDICASQISKLKREKLLSEEPGCIRLTPRGIIMSDEVFTELL